MLSILGLIAVIIAAYHIYKTARDTNRSAVGWALLTLAFGFGMQLVVPLLIGIIVGIVMLSSGSSQMEIQEAIQIPAMLIGIVCLILSFVGIWLIIRHVSKIPEDAFSASPPPAPPTFDGK